MGVHDGPEYASIPDGVKFDRTIERSIYYNHFEGFTARSNQGLERTRNYFSRLGIVDFVNLVTATDNYHPLEYPNCRTRNDAGDFVPTWMLAEPTFDGLRLSLSESSRLTYGEKPEPWSEYIRSAYLKNDSIDMDVQFTPGLNVVFGGSCSGKSLLVDSVARSITDSFDESDYVNTDYDVEQIQVVNPSGQTPHYLNQSFILRVCDVRYFDKRLEDIEILRRIFPSDEEERQAIEYGMKGLRDAVNKLVNAAKTIESCEEQLAKLPKISRLIVSGQIAANPVQPMLPVDEAIESWAYGKVEYEEDKEFVEGLATFLRENPLLDHNSAHVQGLLQEMELAFRRSELEVEIRGVMESTKKDIDSIMEVGNQESRTKNSQFELLLKIIKSYSKAYGRFFSAVAEISEFSLKIDTQEIESMGHRLFVSNKFELNKDKFLEVLNECFTAQHKITNFDALKPESIFSVGFRKRDPKIKDHIDFVNHIMSRFADMNQKSFKITTSRGEDFDLLSAGWKTSVILDLLLGWQGDNAPLIIDQPEDNLASGYMNRGLISAIKSCKSRKQIILVSHNATIPMLGDAQNVVFCESEGKKISMRSSPLEGSIGDKSAIDLIAEVTDGGKSSIKKRFKKYNLKTFRTDNEA